MNNLPPHPSKVLLVHNGSDHEAHLQHLIAAGLDVSEADPEEGLVRAITVQPDIVVLDFECDVDVTAELKGHAQTRHIPVIALVALTRTQADTDPDRH